MNNLQVIRDDLPSVLLITYRRFEAVSRILQLCQQNDIKRIYVAVDGIRDFSKEGAVDHAKVIDVIESFASTFSGEVRVWERNSNLGCAVSVMSACDWVFKFEESAIILEDDCIPASDFFAFAQLSLPVIRQSDDVWLACGTQFGPFSEKKDSWFLSRFALTWGWTTTADKWKEIRQSFKSKESISGKRLPAWERAYWNEGSRRASLGYVDVWDTILVQQMQVKCKFAILPNVPLVTNIGNDVSATHTHGASKWLHLKLGIFNLPTVPPVIDPDRDKWLSLNFFRIKPRHLVSTKVTRVRDLLSQGSRKFKPLEDRWGNAASEMDENTA